MYTLLQVVHGGALVTSVCHHIPLVIDLTPPVLHIVDDVFYDEDFDIMAIYYQVNIHFPELHDGLAIYFKQ